MATKKKATAAKKKAAPKAVKAAASIGPARTKTAPARALPKSAIREGAPAPDLALPTYDGSIVKLSDLRGKSVIVYFYPRDNTPGCTREAVGFRDARAELTKRNAVVLGVSKDSVASHCKFRDEHALDFPLLSDPSGETLARWGAWGEKSNYGKTFMGILRSTVVVAPDGTVKKHFANVKVDGHIEKVLAALDA